MKFRLISALSLAFAATAFAASPASSKSLFLSDLAYVDYDRVGGGLKSFGPGPSAPAKVAYTAPAKVSAISFGEYDLKAKVGTGGAKPSAPSAAPADYAFKDLYISTIKVAAEPTPVVSPAITAPSSVEAAMVRVALAKDIETPIPGAAVLFGSAIAAGAFWRRRRKKA